MGKYKLLMHIILQYYKTANNDKQVKIYDLNCIK